MIKILVIDDDYTMRQTIADVLTLSGGYFVQDAENGREGVALARKERPDLIICDVEMPLLDGYGVVTALQQDRATATIPFIFLTGKADRDSTRRGMELGADDYIAKPFQVAELLAAVKARLARHEKLQDQFEQKLETLRDNILMAIPHELRTPLSTVIGYSEIIAMDAETLEPEKVRTLANMIQAAGRRLHNLVENYIIYAQIELIMTDTNRVARMRTLREACPNSVLTATAADLSARSGRQLHLDLNAPEVQLPISRNNLEKIVDELLDNAIKFSPPDSLVTAATSMRDGRFYLEIGNQGRGMTPEQIKDIGAYMQFDRRMHEQQGSGLGLVIARRLAELYGGHLTIQSTPHEQTVVQVSLPA